MKLPDFQTEPVQSAEQGIQELRGSMLHLAEETGRAWRGFSHAATSLSQFGQEFAIGTSKVQVAEALGKVRSAKAALEADLSNKFTYTTDEVNQFFGGEDKVPEVVKQAAGGLTKTMVNPDTQEQVQMPRGDIPGWAVNPYRYHRVLSAAAQTAADGISLPGWKNEFLRAAQDEISVGTSRMQESALTERRVYETTKLISLADHAANMGDFQTAKDMMGLANLKPEERVKVDEELLRREGKWGMDFPFGKNDMPLIASTAAGLRSGQNEFDAVDQSGQTHHVNVTGIPQDDRRRHATVLDNYGQGLIQQAKHEQQERQKAYDTTVGKQWLMAFATDNPRVINQTFQQIMKDSSGQLSEAELKKIVDQHHAWLHAADKKAGEGLTDANVFTMNFGASLVQGRQPGSDGKFNIGGTEYDLKTMSPLTLNQLALAQGVKPKDIVNKLLPELQAFQKNKPETDTQRRQTIDAALNRNGWVFDGREKSEMAGARANLQAALTDAISQENAKRKSPMSSAEEAKFADNFLAKSPKQGGMFSSPAPDISGLEPEHVRNIQRVRGELSRQTGVAPFANNQEALAKVSEEIDPYVKAANQVYPETAASLQASKPFDDAAATRVGVEIKVQLKQLEGQVMQARKRATPENIVRQYFLNKGFYGGAP